MTEATEAARVTLAQLNEKLAEFDRRAIELENEATGISLAAMTGDAAARKRLDALNRERSAHELESRNIKSAIRAQEAVVTEAEWAEKEAENAEKAKRALIVSERVAARGKKLDQALLTLAMEAEGLEEDLSELNYQLGIAYPSLANFRAIVERPFLAGLMFQPSGKKLSNGWPADGTLKLRHLAPGERMTFSEITEGYAKTIRRTASMVLGEKEEAA